MKVLHISPTYFSEKSVLGGGERYPYELAHAMSDRADVAFLSFAEKPSFSSAGNLKILLLKRRSLYRNHPLAVSPFSAQLLKWIYWADVLHCYQTHNMVTDFTLLAGKLMNKKLFVTDLGGGHKYSVSSYLSINRFADSFLLISGYSQMLWQKANGKGPSFTDVIYGGVNTQKFRPDPERKIRSVLFVGRVLPHKGIDYLVDAVDSSMSLKIIGPIYDQNYFHFLQEKARGKNVAFLGPVTDDRLIQCYQEAAVTVLPSVYEDCYGSRSEIPELLGLAALESMACGTPVIVTRVASLPEIVQDGETGFVIAPNQSSEIKEKIHELLENPQRAREMGCRARKEILEKFTWQAAADKCLAAYNR